MVQELTVLAYSEHCVSLNGEHAAAAKLRAALACVADKHVPHACAAICEVVGCEVV